MFPIRGEPVFSARLRGTVKTFSPPGRITASSTLFCCNSESGRQYKTRKKAKSSPGWFPEGYEGAGQGHMIQRTIFVVSEYLRKQKKMRVKYENENDTQRENAKRLRINHLERIRILPTASLPPKDLLQIPH
jgi:hypothetical protein